VAKPGLLTRSPSHRRIIRPGGFDYGLHRPVARAGKIPGWPEGRNGHGANAEALRRLRFGGRGLVSELYHSRRRPGSLGAMTDRYWLLPEEMTVIVRRPCRSGKSGCARFQGYVLQLRIVETLNLSSCFKWPSIRRRMQGNGRAGAPQLQIPPRSPSANAKLPLAPRRPGSHLIKE
jgi:hypothetical protein